MASFDIQSAGLTNKVVYNGLNAAVSAYLTVLYLAPGHDKVQKVTLIPRGQAKGLTWFQPGEDPSLISKQQIMARIVGALGGRAAEEVVFGEPEVTTGASGDLQQVQSSPSSLLLYRFVRGYALEKSRDETHLARCCIVCSSNTEMLPQQSLDQLGGPHNPTCSQVTQMARAMVVNYGFSDIGPWSLLDPSASSQDMIMRMMARNQVSENLQRKIDVAVREIASKAYETALAHIRCNLTCFAAVMSAKATAVHGCPY